MVWDTGGIVGAGETQLHAQVQRAAKAAMRESDLILFMVDAQQGLTPIDQELARMLHRSSASVVLVINKIDHPKHEDLTADFARLGFDNAVPMSAAHGRRPNESAGNDRSPAVFTNQRSKLKHQTCPCPGHRRQAERGQIIAH